MIEQFKSECWDITFTFIIVKNRCEMCNIVRKIQK